MSDGKVILVHLNHPCYGIDTWVAESEEDVHIGHEQGYLTLDWLRQLVKDSTGAPESLQPESKEYILTTDDQDNWFVVNVADLYEFDERVDAENYVFDDLDVTSVGFSTEPVKFKQWRI